jgi:hypothetical protein
MDRDTLETPQDEREVAALALFKAQIAAGEEPTRWATPGRAQEGDPDAILVDSKGYEESTRKLKWMKFFQPKLPEFIALYEEGYRLAHASFKVDDGRKVVIHYWRHPVSGHVARHKFKR